jgi:hypothetical protein
MDSGELEILRGDVDALVAELATERFRHVAGIEAEPSLAALFRAHGRAAHKDTVKALEAEGEKDLAARVAALRVERAQAEDEETWRAAEAKASAPGPDGVVALADAQLAIAGERDRERRLALGRAVADAASLAARDAAAETRARARAEVGLLPDWDRVVEADALLAVSDDAYRDVLAWLSHREAGLMPPPHGDLTRADLLFVVALHGWEGHFPRGMLALTLERTAAALRLDLSRIRVDDAARPAQWPGAHALETRVALRRQGGPADWLGLFDAVGQAVAAAAAPAHRRHGAATMTIGSLLAGLLLDRGFLATRLDVEKKRAADLVRALALRQLFRLRTRAAACRVATEVERGTSGAAWHEAHREAMALSALASWPHGLAARDGDAGAAAAALQGAARGERLRHTLVERYDEDWWKNPRSFEALGTWLAAGGAWPDEEPKLALAAEALVAKIE